MQNEYSNAGNAFADSVSSFSSADITVTKKDKKPLIINLIIRSLLFAVCIGVFCFSCIMIISKANEKAAVEELYDAVRPSETGSAVEKSANLPEPSPMYTLSDMLSAGSSYNDYLEDVVSPDTAARRLSYYRNYLTFLSTYKDAYAWIYVSYTEIDYPVMKGKTNNFYLTHNYKGESSSSGSIYAEDRMSNDYNANLNTCIYGHCMKNGTMFRTLKTFMESANRYTLAKDMVIEVYTKQGLYIYKPISGYRADGANFIKTAFPNTGTYLEWLDGITALDTLRLSRKYDENSRICTLVTCANVSSNDDERYVLHGVLTSFIPADQIG